MSNDQFFDVVVSALRMSALIVQAGASPATLRLTVIAPDTGQPIGEISPQAHEGLRRRHVPDGEASIQLTIVGVGSESRKHFIRLINHTVELIDTGKNVATINSGHHGPIAKISIYPSNES